MTPRLTRLWITAALAGAMLASAGVGVIVGASTVPQLHACVQKTTNLMRYVSGTTCKTGEKLLTWNTQGVAGAKGAPGVAGPVGPQGPAGPSGGGTGEGLTYYQVETKVTEPAFGTVYIAARLRVPAGSYLVDVDGVVPIVAAHILNRPPDTANVHCDVPVLKDAKEGAADSTFFFSISHNVTFSGPTTIEVDCVVTVASGGPIQGVSDVLITAYVGRQLDALPIP